MWTTVKLGDICDISIGKTPSRGDKRYWDKEKKTENVWLSIADLTSVIGRYISDSKEYVSDEGAKLFKPVPKDTLVMSFKLSIGKLAITQRELRTNEAIAALLIKDDSLVTKEFLYHYLSSLDWGVLAGNDEKVKGKTLNKKKLNVLEVTLPPLAEQQRIVDKLDAAFAEIDKAIKLVETKQANAEKLKASVLDVSLKGDDALRKTVKLGDALSIARGGSPRPIKSFITDADDGVNWIKIGDTSQGGRYIESTKEKIKPSGISRSRYVKTGDFLLSNSMSFGRPYILKRVITESGVQRG